MINNGHVVVNDRGRTLEDLTGLDTQFRFAYEKPGIAIAIARFSADAAGMTIHRLTGDLRFDRGSIRARDMAIETDRTKLVTSISYAGPQDRVLDIALNAERLSLPELTHS